MTSTILIADDDPVQRRLLEAMTRRFGYEVETVESGEQALSRMTQAGAPPIALLVLDLVMPDLDGMGVLGRMRDLKLTTPVIVQTANGSIETVISAMRAGAQDFVVKPVGAERLQISIKNALSIDALAGEMRRVSKRSQGLLTFKDLVSRSPEMARVIRLGERSAHSTIPVLIEGESGVGKEIVARAIQGASDRRGKPFITVNCGALPANLVEFDSVRPREGRLHRRHRKARRKIPRGQWRHAVSRRNRRIAARFAGQAAARAAGRRGRPDRREAAGARRCAG